VLGKQQGDGGWSLTSLAGNWKRHDGTPQEEKSDGYATGLVVLVQREAGVTLGNERYKAAIDWLAANQNRKDGSWPGYSLNKNEANHISPETARFMTDAATVYAVLALTQGARR